MRPFFEVTDPGLRGGRTAPHLPHDGCVLALVEPVRRAFVELLVQRDVMVTGYHELQLCGVGFEHLDRVFIFVCTAGIGFSISILVACVLSGDG